jgi:hypothetical protein
MTTAMSSATDWVEGSNWFTVVIAIHHPGAATMSFGQAKFPGWVAVVVVLLLLGINFALALARYLRRFKVLYGIHRTVVDCWFNCKVEIGIA